MYWDDHPFPHFHPIAAWREAKVRIDRIEVLESTLTRRQLRMLCKLAAAHQPELAKNWLRARNRDERRRGWDSNPRTPCDVNSFRDCPVQPLRHPSENSGFGS
jgi:hypothetical protein